MNAFPFESASTRLGLLQKMTMTQSSSTAEALLCARSAEKESNQRRPNETLTTVHKSTEITLKPSYRDKNQSFTVSKKETRSIWQRLACKITREANCEVEESIGPELARRSCAPQSVR